MSRRFGVAALCLMAAAGTGGCGNPLQEAVEGEIRERVSSRTPPAFLEGVRWSLVQQVYRDREHRPIWIRGRRPGGRARDLLGSLCQAGREGLRPADYDLDGLREALLELQHEDEPRPAELAALDLRLTGLLLALGSDLLSGRLDPAAVDGGWYVKSHRSTVDSTLRSALEHDESPDMLEALRPRQKQYRELVDALHQLREVLRAGGWPEVPPGKRLRRGDRGARVAALRERLRATGDLQGPKDAEPVYDDDVAGAVARFQARHGIEADSSVGRATLAELNVPAGARIRQVELNLDRYRWLPAEFEKRYVLVNIPEFRLYAYEGGRPAFEQRVIVGEDYRSATPVFADSMTYIVFRPEWNVPTSILVNEMLPKLREHKYDLAAHGLELLDTAGDSLVRDPSSVDWDDVDVEDLRYRVRQKPGPRNSLGLVKFMFPNRFNVYLHDTPARELFERSERTLSHGCVRVENPVQLADFSLDGQGAWDEETVREAIDDSTGASREVPLEHPVPVYLLYLTAFVRDGELHFRGDPYGKDRRAMARLGEPALDEPPVCEELTRLLGG